jgi:hypothetical protein
LHNYGEIAAFSLISQYMKMPLNRACEAKAEKKKMKQDQLSKKKRKNRDFRLVQRRKACVKFNTGDYFFSKEKREKTARETKAAIKKLRREATLGPAHVEKKEKKEATGADAVDRVVKFSGVTDNKDPPQRRGRGRPRKEKKNLSEIIGPPNKKSK